MKLTSRKYQSGDEIYINKLYKTVAGVDRNRDEYKWEWLDTWNGQGSVWLLFDEDRNEKDQLIGQYSLIPTPFSIFGKSYLAGKTENCMLRLEYRGKGIYFPHEKKSFGEAKDRFQMFFTTTGNVGAAWAVRMKLGYVALDSWVRYCYYVNLDYLKNTIYSKIKNRFRSLFGLVRILSIVMTKTYSILTKIFSLKSVNGSIRLCDENSSPIDEIEELWKRNKKLYGISVDRISSYLNWRINKNTYHEHFYLLQYANGKLGGYIIFFIDNKDVIHIVDILADKWDKKIFKELLYHLKTYSIVKNVTAIICSTLKSNKGLIRILRHNIFINAGIFSLKSGFLKKSKIKDFYFFIEENIRNKEMLDPKNWYITDLVKEGR